MSKIVSAGGCMGAPFGGRQGRQKHGRQNGNDSNDNQQFDKGKRPFISVTHKGLLGRYCFR